MLCGRPFARRVTFYVVVGEPTIGAERAEIARDTARDIKRAYQAIRWGKERRTVYHLAVLGVELVSGPVIERTGRSFVRPGKDVEEPLGEVAGVVASAVAANAGNRLW